MLKLNPLLKYGFQEVDDLSEIYALLHKQNTDKQLVYEENNDLLAYIKLIDSETVNINGNVNVLDNLYVSGSIFQEGEFYETHVEHLYSNNDLINLRDGNNLALAIDQLAGFRILNYDGNNNLLLAVGVDGYARVGDESGTLQRLATIVDNPVNNQFAYYDNTEKILKTRLIDYSEIQNTPVINTHTQNTDYKILNATKTIINAVFGGSSSVAWVSVNFVTTTFTSTKNTYKPIITVADGNVNKFNTVDVYDANNNLLHSQTVTFLQNYTTKGFVYPQTFNYYFVLNFFLKKDIVYKIKARKSDNSTFSCYIYSTTATAFDGINYQNSLVLTYNSTDYTSRSFFMNILGENSNTIECKEEDIYIADLPLIDYIKQFDEFSLINHTHDYSSLFAALNHTHDYSNLFAALNHTHDLSDYYNTTNANLSTINWSAKILTVNDTLIIDRSNGIAKPFYFRTGGQNRWKIESTASTETLIDNAGSDFLITRYLDDLSTKVTFVTNRHTGYTSLGGNPQTSPYSSLHVRNSSTNEGIVTLTIEDAKNSSEYLPRSLSSRLLFSSGDSSGQFERSYIGYFNDQTTGAYGGMEFGVTTSTTLLERVLRLTPKKRLLFNTFSEGTETTEQVRFNGDTSIFDTNVLDTTELIVNGTFADTSNWTAVNGILTVASNIATLTETDASVISPYIYQAINTIIGQKYLFTCDFVSQSNMYSIQIAAATTASSTNNCLNYADNLNTAHTIKMSFTATAATTYIRISGTSLSNIQGSFSVQNATCKRVKGGDLGIFGNLGIGQSSDVATCKLDINSNIIRLRNPYTPVLASEGYQGDIGWDDNYIYVRTSTGMKKVALTVL